MDNQNRECTVGNQVCFRITGVILCMSRDVKIVQDTCIVGNMGKIGNGGVGGKKGYIYLNRGDFFVQLVRYDNFVCYPAFYCLMNKTMSHIHLAQPPMT
jgi:hypothetical protein